MKGRPGNSMSFTSRFLFMNFVLATGGFAQRAFAQSAGGDVIPPPPVQLLPGSESFFGEKGVPEKNTQAEQDNIDPEHAFDPNTGHNFHWDCVKKTWIDDTTGKPVGFHGARGPDGSVIPPPPIQLLPGSESFFGEKGVPEKNTQAEQEANDPEHAFDPNTGHNFHWDAVKKTWIDDTTGKAVGFHGARSKKPCPPKNGCSEIGMTTPEPGQDARSNLAPARIIQGGTSPGFAGEIKTPPGLNTIIFTTERGNRIEVYMPNRLFDGKSFSGSMKVIFRNLVDQNELTGYSIKVGGQQTALSNGIFSVALPTQPPAQSMTDLVVLDKKGKQKVGVSLPVYPALPLLPREFDLPSSGTSGDLIVVQGPTEGTIVPTDYVKIGGQNIQLLAKSESQLVALNTNDVAGLTEIEIKTSGRVAKSPFRDLTLKIWADKYHLLKGEGTTVHMLVSGLEKLEAPASMTIDTTGTVEMNGGNSQALSIAAGEVKPDGTYSTDRHLSSYAAGDFEVSVVVKATPNCISSGQP